jgi:hypothetical protein
VGELLTAFLFILPLHMYRVLYRDITKGLKKSIRVKVVLQPIFESLSIFVLDSIAN